MSIEISGGGAVAVTTEALLEAERMLGAAAARAHTARASADSAAALVDSVDPEARAMLGLAAREFGELAADAERLGADLRRAAESYGWAERGQLTAQRLLAWVLGPAVTAGAAVTALAAASLRAHGPSGTDRSFIVALRGVADALVPGSLLAARVVPGALAETPVDAVRVRGASVPDTAVAPAGFAGLAARIPAAQEGAPQVRVERYALPGGAVHWVVYVAGTSDWAIKPGTNPWDDTSNVVGLAGRSAGSTRATMAALAKAGWRPGEPVVPVGHSQGGIVASAIAASGAAPVPMLVTFGSPTAQAPVPRGTLAVAVEHRDDPVPALGGSPGLLDRRLVIRDSAPAASGAGAVPSHAMTGYAQTAHELDASHDPRVLSAREALAGFTGGQTPEVTMWRGERLSPGGAG